MKSLYETENHFLEMFIDKNIDIKPLNENTKKQLLSNIDYFTECCPEISCLN